MIKLDQMSEAFEKAIHATHLHQAQRSSTTSLVLHCVSAHGRAQVTDSFQFCLGCLGDSSDMYA
jgi:hypothetical protein